MTPTQQQEIILLGTTRFDFNKPVKLEPDDLPRTYKVIEPNGDVVALAAVDPEDEKPVFKLL